MHFPSLKNITTSENKQQSLQCSVSKGQPESVDTRRRSSQRLFHGQQALQCRAVPAGTRVNGNKLHESYKNIFTELELD